MTVPAVKEEDVEGRYDKITGMAKCGGANVDIGDIWGTGLDAAHCPLIGDLTAAVATERALLGRVPRPRHLRGRHCLPRGAEAPGLLLLQGRHAPTVRREGAVQHESEPEVPRGLH